jgi:mRNA interferase MazF
MARAGRPAPRRGEVYLVDFDPTRGAEIQKTRPALIIQNDVGNRHSDVTIVAAITSRSRATLYPTEVLIGAGEAGLAIDSVVLLSQIRSVDKTRLGRRLGMIEPESLAAVSKALAISVGILDLS